MLHQPFSCDSFIALSISSYGPFSSAQLLSDDDQQFGVRPAAMSTPNPASAGQQVKNRHEKGATDDRPHDGKRIAAHAEDEWLGEVQLPRHPRSEQGADEPDGGGHQKPASRSAAKSPADGATDRGDNDQHDESWQRERHAYLLEI